MPARCRTVPAGAPLCTDRSMPMTATVAGNLSADCRRITTERTGDRRKPRVRVVDENGANLFAFMGARAGMLGLHRFGCMCAPVIVTGSCTTDGTCRLCRASIVSPTAAGCGGADHVGICRPSAISLSVPLGHRSSPRPAGRPALRSGERHPPFEAVGSVGPWQSGGISPAQVRVGQALAEAQDRPYDPFGAAI